MSGRHDSNGCLSVLIILIATLIILGAEGVERPAGAVIG